MHPCIILYTVTKENGKFSYRALFEKKRIETFKRRKLVNFDTLSKAKLKFWRKTNKYVKNTGVNWHFELYNAIWQSWSVFPFLGRISFPIADAM